MIVSDCPVLHQMSVKIRVEMNPHDKPRTIPGSLVVPVSEITVIVAATTTFVVIVSVAALVRSALLLLLPRLVCDQKLVPAPFFAVLLSATRT